MLQATRHSRRALPQNPFCHARLPCLDRSKVSGIGAEVGNMDYFTTPHSTLNRQPVVDVL
jgi:hypothetical protein